MRLRRRPSQRGDTIIEVMFAFSVFSLVAILSVSIMNRGVATSQQALEITQVRIQMDAQANTLHYLHDLYIGDPDNPEWKTMTSLSKQGVTTASEYGKVDGSNCIVPGVSGVGGKSFILNARTAKVGPQPVASPPDAAVPYSQVIYNDSRGIDSAYGIWVEAVAVAAIGKVPGYTDFHIRACWSASGQTNPMTLGTIVRLYEPTRD